MSARGDWTRVGILREGVRVLWTSLGLSGPPSCCSGSASDSYPGPLSFLDVYLSFLLLSSSSFRFSVLSRVKGSLAGLEPVWILSRDRDPDLVPVPIPVPIPVLVPVLVLVRGEKRPLLSGSFVDLVEMG